MSMDGPGGAGSTGEPGKINWWNPLKALGEATGLWSGSTVTPAADKQESGVASGVPTAARASLSTRLIEGLEYLMAPDEIKAAIREHFSSAAKSTGKSHPSFSRFTEILGEMAEKGHDKPPELLTYLHADNDNLWASAMEKSVGKLENMAGKQETDDPRFRDDTGEIRTRLDKITTDILPPEDQPTTSLKRIDQAAGSLQIKCQRADLPVEVIETTNTLFEELHTKCMDDDLEGVWSLYQNSPFLQHALGADCKENIQGLRNLKKTLQQQIADFAREHQLEDYLKDGPLPDYEAFSAIRFKDAYGPQSRVDDYLKLMQENSATLTSDYYGSTPDNELVKEYLTSPTITNIKALALHAQKMQRNPEKLKGDTSCVDTVYKAMLEKFYQREQTFDQYNQLFFLRYVQLILKEGKKLPELPMGNYRGVSTATSSLSLELTPKTEDEIRKQLTRSATQREDLNAMSKRLRTDLTGDGRKLIEQWIRGEQPE